MKDRLNLSSWLCFVIAAACLCSLSQAQPPPVTQAPPLPYVSLGSTDGVDREYVGHFDDGVSHAIHIPDGFPFGNLIHSSVYVGTNGIISFSAPFYSAAATPFPGLSTTVSAAYLVAPYWDDVDIRLAGNVSYEMHSIRSNSLESNRLLSDISSYIATSTGEPFQGTWMLIAEWEEVHPWPHGLNNPIFTLFFPEIPLNNTWQGLVITNGTTSYAVFTYRCGDMNWAYGPTIGYNAAGDYYVNHPNTGSPNGEEIACLNSPSSEWYNLVYQISNPNGTEPVDVPPTAEPPQNSYLNLLDFTNASTISGTLPPCQNCTVAISTPGLGFPFGSYYHNTIYIGTNGIFSFGRDFRQDLPQPFPSLDAEVYFSYLVAPYWSNIDTRLDGRVNYEVYAAGESTTADSYLQRATTLINTEQDTAFRGNWMVVATWDGVHPFPHGNSAEQDREDPYLQSVNTFQGVLITNGTKSFSIFTYLCDQLEWSDESTVGYNAAGDYTGTHPLSGTLYANALDCLHTNINVSVNNIIYDLVPGQLNTGPTPEPRTSLGSCVEAGYSDCCEDSFCLGDLGDCFCDEFCYNFDDCCDDVPDICSTEAPGGNGSYLIFGNLQLLTRVNLTGGDLHVLVHQPNTAVLGVDYDFQRGYLYWSEGIGDFMYRSAMDGSNIEVLLNTSVDVVDDIALDWVGNNLYWTDAVYARIEVMDLDTMYRMEVLRTGGNTIPRAIAVDPGTRFMYWTDWGTEAKIERASMDGTGRTVLHSTGLTWPNGLTIDYPAQTIYWADAFLDNIEYSNVDGTGRFLLLSQLDHPFSITLEGNILFWTDWINNAIHATHKTLSTGEFLVYNNLRDRPFGIEAVTPTRQAQNLTNPCSGNTCSFMCLLSVADSRGYTCACPDGYELASDNTGCTFVSTPRPPNAPGSCMEAGYQNCCIGGYCAGSPPSCLCDSACHQRGDCCPDVNQTCPAGSCAAAGYRACCTDGSACVGSGGCFCDFACTFFGDCCPDFTDLCPIELGSVIGSCAAAGYSGCCGNGSECLGSPANCRCDDECRDIGDCCSDIAVTCPVLPSGNFTAQTTWLPYLSLRSTPNVTTVTVPSLDDGASAAIPIPTGFPIGNSNQSVAYIGTNGVIAFQQPFTHHIPSLFPSDLTFISSAYLLAPFWSDIDISFYGSIFYEVHNTTNSPLLSQVNAFISNYTETDFTGTWMLVTQFDEVHQFPGLLTIPTNTFQAIAITDGSQSYAIYTYRCGDLQWSGGATIGYNGGEIGDFFENHPLSGDTASSIACVNSGVTEFSNVVYNISIDVYLPTAEPPTIEPPQDVYLEFLERTDNSVTMPRCDDCVSDAINITANPVPFGDLIHYVAHVATNGIISFGSQFPHFSATLFPNPNNPTVFNSYVAAPYWADIDNRNFGEIWYETHRAGQSSTSDTLLGRVSNLVRSEQSVPSFQGTWMIVAMWNSSVPFAGTGSVTNTFQGIVITDGNKTYAVYTYHCDDIEWSDGSVIGFNAGGSYYVNHPLSDSLSARDIDCVHSPGSEWNNVVYDVNPNGTVTAIPPATTNGWLPYLPLNATPGVTTRLVPAFDDDSTPPIPIPIGFPIGNSIQSVAFIGTNGMISFQQPFTHHIPFLFPSEFTFISSAYLLAPFWNDVDIRVQGSIPYEVHTGSSSPLVSQVNAFISNYTGNDFTGQWMLVAQWTGVPPFPGAFATTFNTYQAIAITDGSQSYAVYTYRCGDLQWSGGATIGFNGGPVGNLYANHPLSGGIASSIACVNTGITEWSNVVYNVSIDGFIATEPPPTIEPPQSVYLEFIERTNNSITMDRCDDCSSDAIDLSSYPVPFGDYYHYVAHITSNGLISFGQQFPNFAATLFPNEDDIVVFTAFLAAPYWADIDNRNLGEIWYETHRAGQSSTSDTLLGRVSTLVRSEQGVPSFQGTWMIVATWNSTVPFAGSGSVINTFQGIVITDGNKTYAVYTYHCDDIQWSDGSVVGFNAGGSYYANHPLSDSLFARDIDCVHSPGSEWNNVIYDVNPNGTSIFTPPPLSGSCAEAGYTECCDDFVCEGAPIPDCYCDAGCRSFGDCCSDIDDTCPIAPISGVPIVLANSYEIVQFGSNGGTSVPILPFDFSTYYIGLDYDYWRNYLYLSDVASGIIMRTSLNGTSPEVLLTLQFEYIEDFAVDWVANNLYWTDGVSRRIEVFDLDTRSKAVLVSTGAHTAPRAIVVDPNTRYMYWSDWGEPAMIERASMDGSNRETLHNTGLMWPNGLTIDYPLQRLYWADAFHDRIEYSSVDGRGREILLTIVNNLHHPFSITISGNQVFWTDWDNITVYTAHKQLPISILPVYEGTFFLPNGLEAIDPDRQLTNITNYCQGSSCSHLCLLSSTSSNGYTCACPETSTLMSDGVTCTAVSNVTTGPPPAGSCVAAGYGGCCNGGFCAGSPPTCFCELECINFQDCCNDFYELCYNATATPPLTTTQSPTTPRPTTPQPTIPPTAIPGAVQQLAVTSPSDSNDTLTVSWNQASGVVSQYYIVVTNYSFIPVTSFTVAGDQTTTTVPGLRPFVPYYVYVIASNALGNGSSVSALMFTQEGAPPIAPPNIKVEATNDKLLVTWELLTPQQAWGFVTNYTISYGKGEESDTTEKTVDAMTNSYLIEDIDPNQDYVIVLWANTTVGMGQPSSPITKTTSTAAPNVGGSGATGGTIAGSFIAVIVGLVVAVLVVAIAIWLYRRHYKKTYDVFNNEVSYDSKDQQVTVSMDAYQPSSQAIQKNKLDFGDDDDTEVLITQSGASYKPLGDIASFDNPVYETELSLPGEMIHYADEDEEKKDLALDDSDLI